MHRHLWLLVAALLAACGPTSPAQGDASPDLDPPDLADAAPDLDAPDLPDDAPPDLDVSPDADMGADMPDAPPVEPLPPLPDEAPRALLAPAYPLPGERTFTCRVHPEDAQIIWRRGDQEVGRGPTLTTTLAAGEAVTCEASVGGVEVATATAQAARMGMVADLDQRPASPPASASAPFGSPQELVDEASALRWVTDHESWVTDGSSLGTTREIGRHGFTSLLHVDAQHVVTEGERGATLIMRREAPLGPPALDLRARSLVKLLALVPCLSGERCALVERIADETRYIAQGVELWRIGSESQPAALIWAADERATHVHPVVIDDALWLMVRGGLPRVVEIAQTVTERAVDGLVRQGGRCTIVDDALARLEPASGLLEPVQGMPAGEPVAAVDLGDGCAALVRDGATTLLVEATARGVLSAALQTGDVALLPFDGRAGAEQYAGRDVWTFSGEALVRIARPWGERRAVQPARHITTAGRNLAATGFSSAPRASEPRELYARAAERWSTLHHTSQSLSEIVGVAGQRLVFGPQNGAQSLRAGTLDGRAAGPLEPWATEGTSPLLSTQRDSPPILALGARGAIWHLTPNGPSQLPDSTQYNLLGRAAELDGVAVVPRGGAPLLWVEADGTRAEERGGLPDGAFVREVFVSDGALHALVMRVGQGIYRADARRRWSLVAPTAWVTSITSLEAKRTILTDEVTGASYELRAGQLVALPTSPRAVTPTRLLMPRGSVHDRRCVLEASGVEQEVAREMCDGVIAAHGERLITLRHATSQRPGEVWVIEPGEATARLRATLPAVGGVARVYEVAASARAAYFKLWSAEGGEELWAWDEASGVRQVADLWPGPTDSRPESLMVADDALYFIATSPAGRTLWRLDGPDATPVALHPALPDVLPSRILGRDPDGRMWFSAWTRDHGEELWTLLP